MRIETRRDNEDRCGSGKVSRRQMRRFLNGFEEEFDLSTLSERDRDRCLYWLSYEAPRWADTISLVLASSPLRVLDVGCEFAVCSLFMKRQCGLEVIGLDAPWRAEELQDYWRCNGLDVRACDIIHDPLPFEEASFDVILLPEVIEHLRCPPVLVIKRLLPLLKRGGRLIVTTPNVCRLSNILHLLEGRNIILPLMDTQGQPGVHPTDNWYHIREMTPQETVAAVRDAGFRNVKLHMSACWDGPGASGERSMFRKFLKAIWLPAAKCFPRWRACIMAEGERK